MHYDKHEEGRPVGFYGTHMISVLNIVRRTGETVSSPPHLSSATRSRITFLTASTAWTARTKGPQALLEGGTQNDCGIARGLLAHVRRECVRWPTKPRSSFDWLARDACGPGLVFGYRDGAELVRLLLSIHATVEFEDNVLCLRHIGLGTG